MRAKIGTACCCILSIAIFLQSCDNNPLVDDGNNSPFTLIASIDGNFMGIKLYDACNFSNIDAIPVTQGVPLFIESKNDFSSLYSVVPGEYGNNNLLVFSGKPYSIQSVNPCIGWRVSKSYSEKYLFVYGDFYTTLQVFDANNISLIKEQALVGRISLMIASTSKELMYGVRIDTNYTGVFTYNIDTFSIQKETQISNIAERPVDIAISPDGRFVFFTTFLGSQSFGGKFYAFDLTTDQIISEDFCPALASVCVSPDGNSVYITDPAGYEYEVEPTGKLLKYNVINKTIEVFIDWVPYNLTGGAFGGRLITERITISKDGRYLFITTAAGRASNGEIIDVIKLRIEDKKVVDYLSLPLDYRGYKTESVVNIKLINY